MKKLIRGFIPSNIIFYYRLIRDYAPFLSKFRKLDLYPTIEIIAPDSSLVQGSFEIEETEFLVEMFKDRDVFINVGANIGYYCLLALHYSCEVIAFEPVEENLRLLSKNIHKNMKENSKVFIYPIGLDDNVSIKEVYGSSTGASFVSGWAGANKEISRYFPVNTFDNIIGKTFHNKSNIVLIDVEGWELNVLKGAKNFIMNADDTIFLIEICLDENRPTKNNKNKFLEPFRLMESFGYIAFHISKKNKILTSDELSEKIDKGDLPVYQGKPNFIFKKNK